MPLPSRPHLLGIDDGPFEKRASLDTPIVGVLMEAHDLVEAVAITAFPIDGDGVTDFLAGWIESLRFRPALQGVVLGGITLAGLAVVDVSGLAARLGVPVVTVNRREPRDARLLAALDAAGLGERRALVEATPPPHPVGDRLYAAGAGLTPDETVALVRASRGKSELPEPLRLAHLIAAAIARGQSRGRP
jgi:endonuclease V-like protein UPF0215 family